MPGPKQRLLSATTALCLALSLATEAYAFGHGGRRRDEGRPFHGAGTSGVGPFRRALRRLSFRRWHCGYHSGHAMCPFRAPFRARRPAFAHGSAVGMVARHAFAHGFDHGGWAAPRRLLAWSLWLRMGLGRSGLLALLLERRALLRAVAGRLLRSVFRLWARRTLRRAFLARLFGYGAYPPSHFGGDYYARAPRRHHRHEQPETQATGSEACAAKSPGVPLCRSTASRKRSSRAPRRPIC